MKLTFRLGAALLLLLGGAAADAATAASSPPDSVLGRQQGALVDALIGKTEYHVVREGETMLDIAWQAGLGFVELRAANPDLDPWLPKPGMAVLLPKAHLLPNAPRRGLVINLGDLRVYYFPPKGEPQSFPIGIGSEGNSTPLGGTRIVRKQENPTWYPPTSIRAEKPELPAAVPPGPDNPLGSYALYLGWTHGNWRVHGTNKPYGVGRRVSHGCIRMYPEDIERLFRQITSGTDVTVVNQPVKLGWFGGELFLEVHPSPGQVDEVEASGRFTPEPIPQLSDMLVEAAGAQDGRIDWEAVAEIVRERRGMPFQVTR